MIAPNSMLLNGGYGGVQNRIMPTSRPATPIISAPAAPAPAKVTLASTVQQISGQPVPKTGNPIIDSLLQKAIAVKGTLPTAPTMTPTSATLGQLQIPVSRPGSSPAPPPPGAPAKGTAIPSPAPVSLQAPTPGVPTQPTQLSPSPMLPPETSLSPAISGFYRTYGYQSTGEPYASPVPGSLPLSLSGSATAPPTLGMLSAPGGQGFGLPMLLLLGAGVLILVLALR